MLRDAWEPRDQIGGLLSPGGDARIREEVDGPSRETWVTLSIFIQKGQTDKFMGSTGWVQSATLIQFTCPRSKGFLASNLTKKC